MVKHVLVSKVHKESHEKVWWYAIPALKEERRKGSLVTSKTVHNRNRAYLVPLRLLKAPDDDRFPGDFHDRATYQEGDFVKFIMENVTEDSFGTCDLRLSDEWLQRYLNAPTGIGEDVNVNVYPPDSKKYCWLCLGEIRNGGLLSLLTWPYSNFELVDR